MITEKYVEQLELELVLQKTYIDEIQVKPPRFNSKLLTGLLIATIGFYLIVAYVDTETASRPNVHGGTTFSITFTVH